MSDVSDEDGVLNPAKRRRLDKGKGKVVVIDSDEDEEGSASRPSPAVPFSANGQPDSRHSAVAAVARGATGSGASTPMSTYTRTSSRLANETTASERPRRAVAEAEDDLSDEEATGKTGRNQANKWETFQRSWEAVTEDETGGLQGAVDRLLAKARRRR